MNERIKELEAQCWEERKYGPAWFDSKKFAKLIVNECLRMIENEAAQYSEPVWAIELVNDIKEHFGVEE